MATENFIDTGGGGFPNLEIVNAIDIGYSGFTGNILRASDALRFFTDTGWPADQNTRGKKQLYIGWDDDTDHNDAGIVLLYDVTQGSEKGVALQVWEGNVRTYPFTVGTGLKLAAATNTFALNSLTNSIAHEFVIDWKPAGGNDYTISVFQGGVSIGSFAFTGNANGFYVGYACGQKQNVLTAGKQAYIDKSSLFVY